jgi:hypothetical protein
MGILSVVRSSISGYLVNGKFLAITNRQSAYLPKNGKPSAAVALYTKL